MEDRRALDIVDKSLKLVNNKFEVAVLFLNPGVTFPNNYSQVAACSHSHTKHLKVNPNLIVKYCEKIDQLKKKGYMQPVDFSSI